MKIASVQFDSVWEDVETNLNRVEGFVKRAQKAACDVLVLPEMFNSGFSMNATKIAEVEDGKTTQLLSLLAQKYEIQIIAGLTQRADSLYYNCALVFNQSGHLVTKYIKNYPYSNAGEDDVYQAGQQSVIFNMQGVKASVFICYDLRFPELFRTVAHKTDIIFVIASWPSVRQNHWDALLKARAIENQCFIVAVNRTGNDGNGLHYIGGSQVIDPMGEIISMGTAEEEYLVSSLDITDVQVTRNKLPFLDDIK